MGVGAKPSLIDRHAIQQSDQPGGVIGVNMGEDNHVEMVYAIGTQSI